MTTSDGNMAAGDDIATLTTVQSLADADALRMQLQCDGIRTFCPDEYQASLGSPFAGTILGIRIQVAARDLPRAREILQMSRAADNRSACFCPACGSTDATVARSSRLMALLVILLLGLPLFWMGRSFACRACGCRWKRS